MADHRQHVYYLANTLTMDSVWIHFSPDHQDCQRLQLQKEKSTKSVCPVQSGDVSRYLTLCENPFQ
ncbi:hypothetical protein [Salinivibrio kushneri]|uniref:hypothetical protein n=1 Tax=Salinivibrio kushneri TaxID=1908198 RepID=UPI0013017448|nr:hypothetical protein [Salinivibrio kushneri]